MVSDGQLNLLCQVFGIGAFRFGQYIFLAECENQGETASCGMLLPQGVFIATALAVKT
jgi:hypothetical protein